MTGRRRGRACRSGALSTTGDNSSPHSPAGCCAPSVVLSIRSDNFLRRELVGDKSLLRLLLPRGDHPLRSGGVAGHRCGIEIKGRHHGNGEPTRGSGGLGLSSSDGRVFFFLLPLPPAGSLHALGRPILVGELLLRLLWDHDAGGHEGNGGGGVGRIGHGGRVWGEKLWECGWFATDGWARGGHRGRPLCVHADANPFQIWAGNGSKHTRRQTSVCLCQRTGPRFLSTRTQTDAGGRKWLAHWSCPYS